MGPSFSIEDHAGQHGTKIDHTGPYGTVGDHRGPNRTIGDQTGLYIPSLLKNSDGETE